MIEEISNLIVEALLQGNKVIVFGVGGNAANAMHFSAELAGKYEQYESPIPCIDLVSNPSVLTAITNDFGWEHVFERQIAGIGRDGDIVLGFSISTNGDYLHNAFNMADALSCKSILICGRVTKPISTPVTVWELNSDNTPEVQEKQLGIIHQLCEKIKSRMEVA